MRLTESLWLADDAGEIVEQTPGQALRAAAEDAPEAVALVDGNADGPDRRRWTFAELNHLAEATAARLLGLFEPGDRVALWASSVPEWEILQFGASLAGLTLVTVNPGYTPHELEFVLNQSGAAGLIYEPGYRGIDQTAKLAEIQDRLVSVEHIVELPNFDFSPPESMPELPEVDPSGPAMILHTSGTTGKPKGALLSHMGVVNNARYFSQRLAKSAGPVWVNPLPMFHIGGCGFGALGALALRAAHVLVNFDPGHVLRIIEEEQAAFFPVVPTMAVALMEHPDFPSTDVSSIDVLASGGTTVPTELIRRMVDAFGAQFGNVYGQTENSGVICASNVNDAIEDKSARVGRPLARTDVKIVDVTDGTVVPCNIDGEICVRSPGAMLGYFKNDEQTAETLKDGWVHTGDLGQMDERGFVAVTGRLRDIIISGGENIYAREIEDVLMENENVGEAAVLGLPDPYWGEKVAAVIRPAAGRSTTADELTQTLESKLARYKVPKSWFVLDAMPVTASGKIQKFALQEGCLNGEIKSLD